MPKIIRGEDQQNVSEKGPEAEAQSKVAVEQAKPKEEAEEEQEEEMTDEQKAQTFLQEYNTLCQKYGFEVGAKPEWRMTEEGAWVMVVDVRLTRLQGEE